MSFQISPRHSNLFQQETAMVDSLHPGVIGAKEAAIAAATTTGIHDSTGVLSQPVQPSHSSAQGANGSYGATIIRSSHSLIPPLSQCFPTASGVFTAIRTEVGAGTHYMMEDQLTPTTFADDLEPLAANTSITARGRVISDSSATQLDSRSIGRLAVQHQATSFFTLCLDVRRMIYDELSFSLINKTIHLTHDPETGVFAAATPARYKLSAAALNLMETCHQLNYELTGILYGTNTFVSAPGQQNFNAPTFPDPDSMSNLWLHQLRPSTRLTVKKLRLFLDFSLHPKTERIIDALVDVPDVEITVHSPTAFKPSVRLRHIANLKRTCKAIAAARIHANRTVWHNSGSSKVSQWLEGALPTGFEASW